MGIGNISKGTTFGLHRWYMGIPYCSDCRKVRLIQHKYREFGMCSRCLKKLGINADDIYKRWYKEEHEKHKNKDNHKYLTIRERWIRQIVKKRSIEVHHSQQKLEL